MFQCTTLIAGICWWRSCWLAGCNAWVGLQNLDNEKWPHGYYRNVVGNRLGSRNRDSSRNRDRIFIVVWGYRRKGCNYNRILAGRKACLLEFGTDLTMSVTIIMKLFDFPYWSRVDRQLRPFNRGLNSIDRRRYTIAPSQSGQDFGALSQVSWPKCWRPGSPKSSIIS